MTTDVPAGRTIEVLGAGKKLLTVAATAVLLFCAGIAVYGTVHQAGLSGVERAIGAVIALGFGIMGLLFLVDLPGLLGRHTITVDAEAIAYRVTISYVKSFRVTWPELRAINLSMAEREDRTNRSVLVRLDLDPLDPLDPEAFATRHPELARIRRGDSWRLYLGPNPEIVGPLREALLAYSGGRFRGIDDDGRATGWTYR